MVTQARLNVMCTMNSVGKIPIVLPGIRTYSLRPRGHQYSRHWQHYGYWRDIIKLCKTLQLGEPDNNNYMVLGRGPHLTHYENVRVCLLSDVATTRKLHRRQRHKLLTPVLQCPVPSLQTSPAPCVLNTKYANNRLLIEGIFIHLTLVLYRVTRKDFAVITTCHTQYTWDRSICMGLRQRSGLCPSTSRKYPGTEGTNQNRHWNHRRWHATNSLERSRLSCWCL